MSAMEEVHRVLTSGTCEAVKAILQSESGLDLRVKLDSKDRTTLHYLANNLNPGIVDVISEIIGDTIEENNKSTLDFIKSVFFIQTSKKSEITYMKPSDWNPIDYYGRTPLHYAMAAGNPKFVEFLLKKGAAVNVKTPMGVTPFFDALKSSSCLPHRIDCVRIIMEHGSYPEIDIEHYLEFRKTELEIDRDFPLLEPAFSHLVLRSAKGVQFSKKLLGLISQYYKVKDYIVTCEKELNYMKREKISKSVTLYDFLVEEDQKIEFYVDFHVALSEIITNYKFHSYYASILRQRNSEVSKKLALYTEDTLKFSIRTMILTLLGLYVFYNIKSELHSIVEIIILMVGLIIICWNLFQIFSKI